MSSVNNLSSPLALDVNTLSLARRGGAMAVFLCTHGLLVIKDVLRRSALERRSLVAPEFLRDAAALLYALSTSSMLR